MALEDIIKEHAEEVTQAKKQWGPGPWQDEPDRIEFKHAGFDCLLVRNVHMGNWCGYVAVPQDHAAAGWAYDDVPVGVHGGLTYAGSCEGIICHSTDEEFDGVYWFGFDCAHYMDEIPGMLAIRKMMAEKMPRFDVADPFRPKMIYRTAEWARGQTENLAQQLADMGRKPWWKRVMGLK